MKALKQFLLTLFSITLATLIACSNSDDDDEELLTQYMYNMTDNNMFCRVYEFHCIDTGNNTYEVRDYIIHYFLMADSRYELYDGANLRDMIKTRSISAEATSDTLTRTTTSTSTATNATTGEVRKYTLPSGIHFIYYHYGLPTTYTYNTNNDTYMLVNELHYFFKNSGQYYVRQWTSHRFAKAIYSDKSGTDLIDIVKTTSISPSSIKTYTRDDDGKINITDASYYFLLPKGLKYQAYYYE